MHPRDRKALTGARMTLAAGDGQVLRVDHRFGVGGSQNIMHAVATGAIRNRLVAGLGRQSVERGVKTHQPVFRHFHLP